MDTRLVVVGIDEKLNKKLGDLLDQLGFDVSIFTDVISLMNFFESNEATHRSAAVSFQHLPEDALAALSDLTLKIQETLL